MQLRLAGIAPYGCRFVLGPVHAGLAMHIDDPRPQPPSRLRGRWIKGVALAPGYSDVSPSLVPGAACDPRAVRHRAGPNLRQLYRVRHPRHLVGAQLVADLADIGRNVRRSPDVHPRGGRRPARGVRHAIRGIPEEGADKIRWPSQNEGRQD